MKTSPLNKEHFDIVVLGSGPGGYVAAIKAAQMKKKVALIESKELGGTCLNRGCIPTKSLIAGSNLYKKIHQSQTFGITASKVELNYSKMQDHSQNVVTKMRNGLSTLIQSNQITLYKGHGKFINPRELKIQGGSSSIISFDKAIIASGSEPKEIPIFPFDYKQIHCSTSILSLKKLPKSLSIVGGGVIGCEFASLFSTLGVKVSIIEALPSILPLESKHIQEFMTQHFKKNGIDIFAHSCLSKVEKQAKKCLLHLDGQIIQSEMVLVAVGRKLNTDQIGLENLGLDSQKDGSILVNEQMETSVKGIYAIGDITAKALLAHVASHQGIVAATNASGLDASMHYHALPSVIFTNPEIASVGLSLEEALEKGLKAKISQFPFVALGKAQACDETEGFSQIISDPETGEILGAQVLGHDAGNLIAEIALAMQNELTIESISETIHAHPTLSELWLENAFLAANSPIHLPAAKIKRAQ